jgi:hypothetical protein
MNNLLFFMTLIAIGYVVGTLAEKRHYRSIHEREKKFLYLPAVTIKTVTHPDKKIASAELVCGSAVISIDYFKRFLASLRLFQTIPCVPSQYFRRHGQIIRKPD